jgi:amino acid adenylation domain-containing protein
MKSGPLQSGFWAERERQAMEWKQNYNLALPFIQCAARHPERVALVVDGQALRYGVLADRAACLAACLLARRRSGRVGVLATRSVEAYVGVLGACMAGSTYVALNQKWPAERLITLFRLLDLDALVVDRIGAYLLTPEVRAAAPALIIAPDEVSTNGSDGTRFVSFSELAADRLDEAAKMGRDDPGYIIFTSGTTGLPKGVVISAGSLNCYLEESRRWTQLTPEDRVAEAHDITFDLSVHNLFLTLEAGASLHVMPALALMAPAHFIRSHAITAWMSVPTIATMMSRSGALKPGLFGTLRLSIFCGEPLPVATAQAWAAAAPNSVVENIYGPTECTVVMLRQRLTEPPTVTVGRGTLAIGKPFASGKAAILGPDRRPVRDGETGEIALCGPQVGIGYFASAEQTEARFCEIGDERWYLTGDLGLKDADGVFHHLGRTDNQVKVKGNRIELEEVEAHLRKASGSDLVAVVAWPLQDGSPQGLVGFVVGAGPAPEAIRERMWRTLPRYMTPDTIHLRDALPVNVNGKVDRRVLRETLGEVRRERLLA